MASDRDTLLSAFAGAETRSAHRVLVVSLALIAALVLLYWQTFAWLVAEWSSSTTRLSHGFLLASVTLFLLVRSALRVEPAALAPAWPALLPLAAACSLWLLGHVANVAVVETLALPFMGFFALHGALGFAAARRFAFAVFFIFFALPVWEYAEPVFQGLTVVVVTVLLEPLGVPALIDGNVVHIGSGSLQIASGCSGVTFIIVALALTTLYGHLFIDSRRSRLLLVVAGFGMALLANWIRVSGVIAIAHATRMQSSIVEDHHAFGWAIFALGLLPLFLFARRLEDAPAERATHPAGAAESGGPPRISWAALGAVLAVLAAAPLWSARLDAAAVDRSIHLALPAGLAGWRGPAPAVVAWQPRYHGASSGTTVSYADGSGRLYVYSGVYLSQSQGRELIYLHNSVAGDFQAPRDARDRASVAGIEVNTQTAHEGARPWRIWYWYEIAGDRETDETRSKLRQALAALGGPAVAGVFALAAPCDTDCAAADRRLAGFLETAADRLWLDRVVMTLEVKE